MITRAHLTAGLAGVALMAAAATAQDFTPDLYVTAGGGVSTTDDFGEGQFIAGGLGIALPLGLRADATAIHQTGYEVEGTDGDGPEFDTLSGFLSAYYDLPEPFPFLEPYVGGGVGVTQIDVDGGDTETADSYQLSAGVSFVLFKKLALDAGYRYVNYGDFDGVDDITANQFTLMGRYAF